jgi:hypothetical protein
LLIAALLLVGAADARAASSKLRKPTLLWQSYPLIQRPVPELVQSQGIAIGRTPTLQVPASGYGTSSETLILFLLGSLAAAIAGVLLLRSSVFNHPEIFVPSMPSPERQRRDQQASDEPELVVALRPTARPGSEPDESGELGRHETSVPPVLMHPPRNQAAQATGVETCQIYLRGGHLEYQLFAASPEGDAGSRPVAVSASFRLRNEEFPTAQASSALDRVIADLERAGWTVSRLGASWYDLTFERSREEAT